MSEDLQIALDVRLLQNMVSGEIPASNFSRCCMTPGLEPDVQVRKCYAACFDCIREEFSRRKSHLPCPSSREAERTCSRLQPRMITIVGVSAESGHRVDT